MIYLNAHSKKRSMTDDYNANAVEFQDLPSDDDVELNGASKFSEAVVHSTDWTTETIVSQLRRGNILLNPRFQRRDAWKPQHKSRFIESLILGLPIPQIVLAEQKEQRGKFIVLDGKQRLLALMQFWGAGEGANNGYALTGLQVRKELNRKTFKQLESEQKYEEYLNSLLNQPIRTVVIKNWPDTDFLHLIFLRLNTGSVKLSPQELRQAIVPGPFTNWIDQVAVESAELKALLKLDEPDYRMRDIELLARFFAFSHFINDYRGRMKEFLDHAFNEFNANWATYENICATDLLEFAAGVQALVSVFGDRLARKPGGKLFNRAVFDFLIFYSKRPDVRAAFTGNEAPLQQRYEALFNSQNFVSAVERDTAGLPNTVVRIAAWGAALNEVCGLQLALPELIEVDGEQRIHYAGE